MISEQTALQLDREAWAEQDAQDRAEDDARGQRWIDFVTWLRADLARRHGRERFWSLEERVSRALADVSLVMDDPQRYLTGERAEPIREFADVEGWPSVLRAMAQAMDAEIQATADVERRR